MRSLQIIMQLQACVNKLDGYIDSQYPNIFMSSGTKQCDGSGLFKQKMNLILTMDITLMQTFRKCKNLLSTIFMSLSVWLTIMTPTAYRDHESNSTVPENSGCETRHFSQSMFALYKTFPQPLIEPLTA